MLFVFFDGHLRVSLGIHIVTNTVASERDFFTHSLLLTDGSEIEIRFYKFDFKPLQISQAPAPAFSNGLRVPRKHSRALARLSTKASS